MSIRFQYNKTSLQDMNKQLDMRVRALPTIKNKESALRIEVKKAKDQADKIDNELNDKIKDNEKIAALWMEFEPEIIKIKDVDFSVKKIAGVRTPVFENVSFEIQKISLFNKPDWYYDGMMILKEISALKIKRDMFVRKMDLLDHARKKTTQKVNLYEKVQIPGYQEAIRKIKRFLEDEENLSKSSQKIVKQRQQAAEEEEL